MPFTPTKTYGPVSVNLREKWNPFFLSLSCSFLPYFSFPVISFFSSFLFLLIHPHFLLLFVLLLISFSFSFSSFLFHFLFTLFIFALLPYGSKWRKLPATFLLCHMSPLHFFLIFLNFSFLLFPPLDTWLNVSHSYKCTT